MRIAIMGAGAVGGFFGAKLVAASYDVAFIARGAHLAAMQREGLIIESFAGNLHVRDALFTVDPTVVGIADAILFSVKSYETESAAQWLDPMVGEKTVILSLQNVVDNVDKIAHIRGVDSILAVVAY